MIGIPLDAFTEEAFAGLEQGDEDIPVGNIKQAWSALEPPRQKIFRGMVEHMKILSSKHSH